MKRFIVAAGAVALAAVFVPAALLQSKATDAVDTNANTAPGWNLGDLYAGDQAWTTARDKIKADAEHLALYAKMAATAEGFAEYLDQYVYEKKAA